MEWRASNSSPPSASSSLTSRAPCIDVLNVMPQEQGQEAHFPPSVASSVEIAAKNGRSIRGRRSSVSPPPPAVVSLKRSRFRRVFLLALLILVCLIGVFASALGIAYASIVAPASVARSSSHSSHSSSLSSSSIPYTPPDTQDWDDDIDSFDFVIQDPKAIPDYPDSPEMPNLKSVFKKTFSFRRNRRPSVPKQEAEVSRTQPDLNAGPKLPSNKELPASPEVLPEVITLTNNQRTDGTYPRICKLADGTILASFTRIDGKEHALIVAASADNGKTFEEIGEIARGEGDIDNAYLFEVSSVPATIIAAFRNHDFDLQGRPTHYRITVCGSPDGGRSWTYFSQAAESSPPQGIWEPFVRKGSRGDVQITYSHELASDDQRTMLVTSQNRGLTWSKPISLDERANHLRDGMCGIAQTRDSATGKDVLVMVVETTRFPGKFNVEGMLSYDDGMSYEARHIVYNPTPNIVLHNQGNPHVQSPRIPDVYSAGSPQIASFGVDGSLICVFMTDEDVPPNTVEWTRHAAIKAVFAPAPRNGNLEWGPPVKISDAESYWPGVTAIDDRTVMVTYDLNGPKAQFVRWK